MSRQITAVLCELINGANKVLKTKVGGMGVLTEKTPYNSKAEVGTLEASGSSHEKRDFFFFNTTPGISQITYVPYYVAVAMVTTFIF